MNSSQQATFDTLRSIAFGSISGTYAALGTPFSHYTRLICITNNTDGDMFIAFTNGATPLSDGTQDNIFVAANSYKTFDIATNRIMKDSSFGLVQGTQVWVRESSASTQNSVYAEAIYGVGE